MTVCCTCQFCLNWADSKGALAFLMDPLSFCRDSSSHEHQTVELLFHGYKLKMVQINHGMAEKISMNGSFGLALRVDIGSKSSCISVYSFDSPQVVCQC